ncbi:hypothetical protein TNCV_3738791 [Trichonephila clavipes]|nr:hypothetical protein TNCV_3738791 [Trichonephila clavipes]
MGPAVKRNGTSDNFWLRACVECNSESRAGVLPWVSPDTPSMILMIEYKRHIDQLHEGFLVTDLVTLNHSQVTRTTPELAPPIS